MSITATIPKNIIRAARKIRDIDILPEDLLQYDMTIYKLKKYDMTQEGGGVETGTTNDLLQFISDLNASIKSASVYNIFLSLEYEERYGGYLKTTIPKYNEQPISTETKGNNPYDMIAKVKELEFRTKARLDKLSSKYINIFSPFKNENTEGDEEGNLFLTNDVFWPTSVIPIIDTLQTEDKSFKGNIVKARNLIETIETKEDGQLIILTYTLGDLTPKNVKYIKITRKAPSLRHSLIVNEELEDGTIIPRQDQHQFKNINQETLETTLSDETGTLSFDIAWNDIADETTGSYRWKSLLAGEFHNHNRILEEFNKDYWSEGFEGTEVRGSDFWPEEYREFVNENGTLEKYFWSGKNGEDNCRYADGSIGGYDNLLPETETSFCFGDYVSSYPGPYNYKSIFTRIRPFTLYWYAYPKGASVRYNEELKNCFSGASKPPDAPEGFKPYYSNLISPFFRNNWVFGEGESSKWERGTPLWTSDKKLFSLDKQSCRAPLPSNQPTGEVNQVLLIEVLRYVYNPNLTEEEIRSIFDSQSLGQGTVDGITYNQVWNENLEVSDKDDFIYNWSNESEEKEFFIVHDIPYDIMEYLLDKNSSDSEFGIKVGAAQIGRDNQFPTGNGSTSFTYDSNAFNDSQYAATKGYPTNNVQWYSWDTVLNKVNRVTGNEFGGEEIKVEFLQEDFTPAKGEDIDGNPIALPPLIFKAPNLISGKALRASWVLQFS